MSLGAGSAVRAFLPRILFLGLVAAVPWAAGAQDTARGRVLTIEERVAAQRAIDAVYQTHVIDAPPPFDDTRREQTARRKVLDDLRLSVALDALWHHRVTEAALDAELRRIARDTRLPSRLESIYDALDRDPLVVREVLARGTLVRRLARRFFATDTRFAAATRAGWTWNDWWASVRGSFDPAVALAPASSLLPLPPPSSASAANGATACAPDDTWSNGILDDHPDPRSLHDAIWTGTHMVVWGGRINNDPAGSGALYDPLTDTWTPTSMVGAPPGKYRHTTVWTGSEMIVWGGEEGPDRTDSGARYDPATDTWTPVSTAGAPEARRDHVAVWTGDEMIVWGGTGATGNPVSLDSGGRYDPVTDSWTSTSVVDAPEARRAATAVWTGTEMIVWGGTTGVSIGDSVNPGGRYDPMTDTWTATSQSGAPLPRMSHSALWTGSVMIVVAGRLAGGTGGRYDPATDTWTPTSLPTLFGVRFDHAAVWTGSEMIVWGGDAGDGISDERGDGERYDPVSDTWTPISAVDAPSARARASAVWTGDRMIVWGGESSGRELLTGGRYDPATDAWLPTHVSDAPGIRQDHAAVWTGTELIVWGGIAPGRGLFQAAPLADGGRYDPLVDAWTPTSAAGAPTARYGHEAVWSGSEMLLWGGLEAGGSTDTGARYDPALDQWTSMATTGAPAARDQHTATWTGDEMVVWGGRLQSGAETETGARYDPNTDTWTALPTLNAPERRRLHTAVWGDGDVMVWGGITEVLNDPVELNSGARYRVSLDAWIPIPRSGAPAPRHAHVSVWTGTELVVWGGRDDVAGTTLGDGGRYDRAANVWLPTGSAGAPEARRFASAVWTGSELLVWGGDSAEFLELSSGGRYDPAADAWSATSQAGAPQGRLEPTLVWTGDSALLWGGHASNHGMNTGGAYAVGNVDTDLDGVADGCDCAPGDPAAFAAPSEVGRLVFADKVSMTWDSLATTAGPGTVYDVLRGALGELPVGAGPSEICLESAGPGVTAADGATPAAGTGFTYLVRGRNACGVGTYGFATGGPERISAACP